MAFKLDNDLLEELGLAALAPEDKQAMLHQILETLEMRVGTTLASRMTDAQLDEFERLMPVESDSREIVQQKEQQALQWLEGNFPNYKQVVNDELEKLKAEIKQSAPQIVAAATQAQPPQPGVPAAAPPVSDSPASPTMGSDPTLGQQQPAFQEPAGVPSQSAPAPAQPYAASQPVQDYSQPPQPPQLQTVSPPQAPPYPTQQPGPGMTAAPMQQYNNPSVSPYQQQPVAPSDQPMQDPSQQPPQAA